MEAVTSLTKSLLHGLTMEPILVLFEKRDMHIAVAKESMERINKEGIELLKRNLELFKKNIAEIEPIAKEWLDWLREIHKKDLKSTSDRELVDFSLKYRAFYKEVYGRYFVVLVLEQPLTKHLQNVLEERCAKDAASAFTILTSSYDAMHTRQEEKERLQIAMQIKKNKEWNDIFLKETKEIEEAVGKDNELLALIEKHLERWFWITRDYEDPVLTKNDVLEKIKETLNAHDVEKKAHEAEHEQQGIERKIVEKEKELQLSEEERRFFAIMREGITLKELRKKIVSQSLYYFDAVIEEISQRTNLPLHLVRMLLPHDFEAVIIEKKDKREDIEKRYNKCVVGCEEGEYSLFQNEEAEQLFTTARKVNKDVKELKGLSGAAGVARGPARIVLHPSDFHKVQEGDIMITVQAVPSFIKPLMLCKGIVADGGSGITSHPATLAREVGIPCVVQTKIATEIIKDGDMVEVDGNNGFMRILKKRYG